MDEAIRRMAKGMIGISDEELDGLSPGVIRMLERSPEIAGHRIVAEVVESKNCFAFYRPGDKLVFNAVMLNKEETTAKRICTEAIAPLNSVIVAMFSSLVNGEDPNKYIFHHVQCLDRGPKHGGLGKVIFKVYVERSE